MSIENDVGRITKCRSCRADIIWLATASGKFMPVDVGTNNSELVFDAKVHTSHFATCPDAAKHRKKKA